MQNLTDYLLKTRKSLGLSQTKLAKELGISQTTWASYEIGKAKPPIKNLAQLTQMGYPYSELTAGSAGLAVEKISEEAGLPPEEVKRQRFEQIKDLPPDTSISEYPLPNYKLDDVDFNLFKFRYGKPLPLEKVNAICIWLKQRELVKIERLDGSLFSMKLTKHGQEVALGYAREDGVDLPIED